MAKKPQRIGMPQPKSFEPRVLSQQEAADRKKRMNRAMLEGPAGSGVAEAIVDLWDGGEPVVLETDAHRLEVTVTPK